MLAELSDSSVQDVCLLAIIRLETPKVVALRESRFHNLMQDRIQTL